MEPISAWTIADYVLVIIIGLSIAISIIRGVVREVLSLLTWIAAVSVSILFASQLSAILLPYVNNPSLSKGLAFVALLFGVLLIGSLLSLFIRFLIRSIGLGPIDRLLGVLFGTARGVLIVAVLLFVADFTTVPEKTWWKSSVFVPQFKPVTAWLQGFLPEEWSSSD